MIPRLFFPAGSLERFRVRVVAAIHQKLNKIPTFPAPPAPIRTLSAFLVRPYKKTVPTTANWTRSGPLPAFGGRLLFCNKPGAFISI
jgi:hypothetical protein